uniref:Uncharacterized protein n=1 Tax=Mus musculus TaxID=10090 RepID=Q9D9Q8_MOUSE|nr:unnamed protein product [Mus musculus]
MADAFSTPMSALQCPPSSAVMDQHLYPLDQPEDLLHTGPQQGILQVPLMLSLPTPVINMSCIPVTLNLQMTPSFSWNPSQPMTIPCLFPNMIMQPSTSTAAPVKLAQVLDSNISSQHPTTANQVPVIWAQNNTFNQVPEVYTQGTVVSTQGSSSAEEHRQKVMDAAEALLILHNSREALQETSTTPGPDGE